MSRFGKWIIAATLAVLVVPTPIARARHAPAGWRGLVGDTSPQPLPTQLPAEVTILSVHILHLVHGRWRPTTVIQLNERVRFTLQWATDSGKIYTAAAANLTVSRDAETAYNAYRENHVISSAGTFQWTVRFRDIHVVGDLVASFDVRLANEATRSLAFTLKGPSRG